MKKATSLLLVLMFIFLFTSCGKSDNRADTSLREGETYINGKVEEVYGNSLLITDDDGGKYYFSYSDEVEVVVNGWYVTDMAADSFNGKQVTVICGEDIMETFPAQLTGERMIIISE